MKHIIFLLSIVALSATASLAQVSDQLDSECLQRVSTCQQDIIAFARAYLALPDQNCRYWHGSCNSEGGIWREGPVIIGATKSGSFAPVNMSARLNVNGGIFSEQLQICRVGWCDFVFEDTFNLMPLTEVNAFVKGNKHLPGVTSGKEIKNQGGFFLEEQTFQQQQKIEEMYLHLFGLNRRIVNLKQQIQEFDGHETVEKSGSKPDYSQYMTEKNGQNTLNVSCFELSGALNSSSATGMAGLIVSGETGPFDITWQGGTLSKVDCAGGLIRVPELLPGDYTFSIKKGDLSASCFTTITVAPENLQICHKINDPRFTCHDNILQLLKDEFSRDQIDCVQWEGSKCESGEHIYRLGDVNIGTPINKSGYSLAVGGGIVADRFKVMLSSDWPDYVFDPNYPLRPLDEVENYTLKNKHLPGMITQSQVIKDGGMNMKQIKLEQQEKIEEAYLYLIQLNKQIEQLNTFIDNQN